MLKHFHVFLSNVSFSRCSIYFLNVYGTKIDKYGYKNAIYTCQHGKPTLKCNSRGSGLHLSCLLHFLCAEYGGCVSLDVLRMTRHSNVYNIQS